MNNYNDEKKLCSVNKMEKTVSVKDKKLLVDSEYFFNEIPVEKEIKRNLKIEEELEKKRRDRLKQKRKREIRKKTLVLSLSIMSLTAATTLIKKAHPYMDFENGEVGFAYINTKNYHYSSEEFLELFKEKFNNNSELVNNFGEIYPEVCAFLSDYGEYLDQEEILDSMSDVEIELVKDDDKRFSKEEIAAYDYYGNKIFLKENVQNKKVEEVKEVKFHEFLHFLFKQQFNGCGTKALDEGTVSLITREYGTYVGVDNYHKCSDYVKCICELVGEDNYMKAFGHHDYKELFDYLGEYGSNSDTRELMRQLDGACSNFDAKGTDYDIRAFEIIDKMYAKKNGVSIENSDDELMKIYSNKLADTHYGITGARSYYQATANKKYFAKCSSDEPEILYNYYKQNYGSAQLDDKNVVISVDVLEEGFYDETGNVVDEEGNSITGNKIKIK